MITTAATIRSVDEQWSKVHWQALYYFNVYRLVLAAALSTLALGRADLVQLGDRSPNLFLAASVALLLVSAVNMYTITQGRPEFRTQASFQFFIDIALITLLSHASGGVSSGLNLLLIVSVAASGVVLSGRLAIFFAALATIFSLAEHAVSVLLYTNSLGSFTQLGLLGIGLFGTGVLLSFAARRARQTQALAERRAAEVLNLAKINELIVARLQTGVLVTDKSGAVQLSNLAAEDLLGKQIRSLDGSIRLTELNPTLAEAYEHWRRRPHDEPGHTPIQLRTQGPAVSPRFAPVAGDAPAGMAVVFLEDASETERQAQSLKLAALGRLTAAIAHEVRNPLAAISHASQLISESISLNEQDRQLTRIINDNSERLDQIIKSILEFGRPRLSKLMLLKLEKWLPEFITTFSQMQKLPTGIIELVRCDATVCVDPDQLHQILVNLCQNSLRHSPPFDATPLITLEGGWFDELSVPYLDVVDRGTGVPEDLRDKIFEPFFTTTEHRGTGLGLYLSRALCENNYGRLDYVPMDGAGSRFRIQFAPDDLCKQSE